MRKGPVVISAKTLILETEKLARNVGPSQNQVQTQPAAEFQWHLSLLTSFAHTDVEMSLLPSWASSSARV